MEVHLRNVPKSLSEDNLSRELRPHLNALGITDWVCEKARWKSVAWVTFLKVSDGAKFLAKHGEVQKPTTPTISNTPSPLTNGQRRKPSGNLARLQVLKTYVYASKSTRQVDRKMLSHLEHKRQEKVRTANQDQDQGIRSTSLAVGHIACGNNVFVGPDKTLCFAEQLQLRMSAKARFTKKLLTINVDQHRLDVPYDTIQDLIVGYNSQTITLVITEPPRVYIELVDKNTEITTWARVICLPSWASQQDLATHSLVYRITVIENNFRASVSAINSLTSLPITRDDLPIMQAQHLSEAQFSRNMENFQAKTSHLLSTRSLPFPIIFQVTALVWNHYLLPSSGHQMLELLEEVSRDHREKKASLPFTCESLKPLFQNIPYPCPGTDPESLDVQELVAQIIETENQLRAEKSRRDPIYGALIPPQHIWIFRAIVTPTRIMLQGPDAESKNRVLRMFPKQNDYFLRVIFCEENGEDLGFNPKVSNENVFKRYREVMRDGIVIANRTFSFLGFSHSSLRSHSAWFSAPFLDENMQWQNYDTILKSLGDFKDIRVPAKCAARIGQAFSETPYSVSLVERNIIVRYIPDVKSPDGSRVFSDGVGTISKGALQEIRPCLSMRAAPTCLQIRMGGCKGMLSLDSTLPGRIINIRKESMEKFPSIDYELGICDTANKPLRLYLNRQMIKIMEDMDVDIGWFFDEQNKAINVLRAVTTSARNTSTFMEYQSIGRNMGFAKLFMQLDRMGIDYRLDKFLKSIVEHVVLRELRLLKHKARIPVGNGVTLFGIMDETGFLNEGEIYVTYDKGYRHTGMRIKDSLRDGPVLVTRSPALHPGDIQVAAMVTPPQGHPLRDLQNCIVFSSKGSRDLPSQLSGGDLDGDLYNVVWDRRALPKKHFAPADYPRVAAPALDRAVTRDDIADFFINFMKTDLLGVIAVRHMIYADVADDGTAGGECLMLAEMHSTAVDFSKTGIPVQYSDMPRPPRTRPDFLAPAPPVQFYDIGQINHIADNEVKDADESMGMSAPKYHLSQKVLGRLYRSIDEKKIWEEDIHIQVDTAGPSVWDQLLGLVGAQIEICGLDIDYSRKSLEAWRIRNLYDSFISENMSHFSENPRVPLSEVEVFCGFILNKRGSQTRRQRDSSTKLNEEMERITTLIVKQIRDLGTGNDAETASSVNGESGRTAEDVIELCWACVVVGCEKNPEMSRWGNGKLESFRVIAACCLLKELNDFFREMEASSSGGGYLGVGGRRRKEVVLPMR